VKWLETSGFLSSVFLVLSRSCLEGWCSWLVRLIVKLLHVRSLEDSSSVLKWCIQRERNTRSFKDCERLELKAVMFKSLYI
jgi:hypothetical protein